MLNLIASNLTSISMTNTFFCFTSNLNLVLVLVDLLFHLINSFLYLASCVFKTLYTHIKQISLGSYLAYCAPPNPRTFFFGSKLFIMQNKVILKNYLKITCINYTYLSIKRSTMVKITKKGYVLTQKCIRKRLLDHQIEK